jgi:hypothetical protein
MSEKEKEQSMN